MKSFVIGTAGHVDHGKTQLVKALTGINTDRLREEAERGISIELGFAFIDFKDGLRAGIVDVPGHEKFIKNMLAGVGGIDVVIMVIAADEGVMPQTREHMDILELLQVKNGIVALTKTDLVDQEWLSLIDEEISQFLKGTVLQGAPVVKVSSVTGQGINVLKETVYQLAQKIRPRSQKGIMRLPVDRVFTLSGFGTVVTGTMTSGALQVGETVELMPQELKSKVRNIHVHGQKVESAGAGQRVAVNISNIEVDQVFRGSVVATPGTLKPALRLDARLQLLGNARKIKNYSRVRIYIGTSEIFGRIRLLDREELEPSQWAYVQLELEKNALALRGDRFVIRSYSPMRTIGGGTIIDVGTIKYSRYHDDVLNSFSIKEEGDPSQLIVQFLESTSSMHNKDEISLNTGIEKKVTAIIIRGLLEQDRVKEVEADGLRWYIDSFTYKNWVSKLKKALISYHQKYPLREGYPKEELRSKIFKSLNARQFQMLLKAMKDDAYISYQSTTVSEPDFAVGPDSELQSKISIIESTFQQKGLQPPSWEETVMHLNMTPNGSQEVLNFLVSKGILVRVSSELLFHNSVIKEIQKKLIQYLNEYNEISVSQFRDIFATSRKYALPLLEHFDQEKITRREGDVRLLGVRIKANKK